jgi:tight adherence protein B
VTLLFPALAALGILLVYAGITSHSEVRKIGIGRSLDRLAHEAGVRGLKGRGLLLVLGFGVLFVFIVTAGVTSSLVVAAAFASAGLWMPLTALRARVDKRRRRFSEAWPDAIAILVAAVRAGVSLPEACVGLTERGPGDLKSGFEAFASTYRATGSFSAALERMRDHLADPVADRVVLALDLAHEVGGTDLVRVLRALSDFVREDVRVRKEIQARWSWTVTAARVAAFAPWAVLLLMTTRPEAAAAYDTPVGASVIGAGAVVTLLGYRLMLRAARLPTEPRLGE